MRDRTTLKWCLILFVAALVVRIAAAAAFGIDGPMVEDERDYYALTHRVARDHDFVRGRVIDGPVSAHESWEWVVDRSTSLRPPLLPFVLAPFVPAGVGSPVELRWVVVVLGALAAPLAYLGLRRTSLGERARWVGLALALWPPAVYLSLRILAEPLASALLLGVLAVPPDTDDRVIPERRSFAAGLLGGLAILARPACLVAVVLVAFTRGGLRRAVWFAIGATLVVAPWVVRNWSIHGRPLLTTNTGVTLVGANSAAAANAEWPGKWVEPEIVYRGAPDPPDAGFYGWNGLSEEASDARFARDAVTWIRENPGGFLRLAFWKVVRLFDPDQHSAKPDAGMKRLVGWLTFAPVLILAVIGFVLARRDATFRPWLAVLAGTVLTTIVFYGDVRMRSPADPTLLALAVLAVTRLLPRADASTGGAPEDGRT